MYKLNKLTLKQREELFRQLRISITHHSNAIEGTTLSFGETKELLELGRTAGHKPLGEQLVILGFAKAYDVVVREAQNPNNIIDSNFIKDIHAIRKKGSGTKFLNFLIFTNKIKALSLRLYALSFFAKQKYINALQFSLISKL